MASTEDRGRLATQPPTGTNSIHAHSRSETQDDDRIHMLADIDGQQPQTTPQAPKTTKHVHQSSVGSEESNPYQTGELVEALKPQFFYRKRVGAHIQSYYVGQDLSPDKAPLEDWIPVLIEGQKGFKLEASFDHVPTGYYNI
ncbi:hypothetical protein BGZ73_000887, partial [Actinomortierella ambigua]